MLEVEWIRSIVSIEGFVIHATDNQTSRQLSTKQFFLDKVQVTSWYRERFADYTLYYLDVEDSKTLAWAR